MSVTTEKSFALRYLLMAASLVVILAGLREAEAIVVPFLVSVFIAILGIPPMLWLQRKGVPSALAILIVILVMLLILTFVGTLIGTSLNDFTNALPRYQARLSTLYNSLIARTEAYGIEVSGTVLKDLANPAAILQLVGGTLGRVAAILSNLILVLLTTTFILSEAAGFPSKVRLAMGEPKADLSRFSGVTQQVQNYLVLKTLVSMATGIAAGLLVWALGVEFAFLWGLVAFLLNYIPNLGSIIAAIPPSLLALTQPDGGPLLALGVVVGFIGVNVVLGSLVEPRLLGSQLGLSTLVVFLSLVFWGWMWGPLGMILSVPLTMILKILLYNSKEFHWVAVLLGPSPSESDASTGEEPGKTARRKSPEAGPAGPSSG